MTEYVDLLRMPERQLRAWMNRRKKAACVLRQHKPPLLKPRTVQKHRHEGHPRWEWGVNVFLWKGVSAHFPVGRFPQLYQESEERIYHEECYSQLLPGKHRSRYCLPLQRGSWVIMGRHKKRVILGVQ